LRVSHREKPKQHEAGCKSERTLQKIGLEGVKKKKHYVCQVKISACNSRKGTRWLKTKIGGKEPTALRAQGTTGPGQQPWEIRGSSWYLRVFNGKGQRQGEYTELKQKRRHIWICARSFQKAKGKVTRGKSAAKKAKISQPSSATGV